MSFTTLSQLGARLSVAKCHVTSLLNVSKGADVNHVFYIVDPANKALGQYAESLTNMGRIKVYSREDNQWSDFKRLRKVGVELGGDVNYDFLIRCPETREFFLTLHDDSVLLSTNVWNYIEDILKDHHFGGYLDTRHFPGYDRILLDGQPLSSLRIGTWFCFGRTDHYIRKKYTMGLYKNYPSWYLNLKFLTLRLRCKGWKTWLNGGFDLNIKARLNGDRFHIGRDHNFAEHWQKITGFFAKRNLLKYADTSEEVDVWREYLRDLKQRDPAQFSTDVDYLAQVAKKIEGFGVRDALINSPRIKEFKAL